MDQAGTTTCFNRTPFHCRGKELQSWGLPGPSTIAEMGMGDRQECQMSKWDRVGKK